MRWDAGGVGATAWTLLAVARKLLSNIVSKRRGPARGGWLIHPMEILAPWAGGQGGPSFQEGLGQEARQEGAGSFWKGGLERPGRAALGLTTQCSWLLSEMGNPWHFLAHARDEGGREGGSGPEDRTGMVGRSSAGLQQVWPWTERRRWEGSRGSDWGHLALALSLPRPPQVILSEELHFQPGGT